MHVLSILLVLLLSSCADDSPRPLVYKQGDAWVKNFRNNSLPSKAFYRDKIYCTNINVGGQHYFYCLNIQNGKVDWVVPVANYASSPPIITDSFIYFSSSLGELYRFNTNGKLVWQTRSVSPYGSHALNPLNNNLMVTTLMGGVAEYSYADGRLLHQYGQKSLSVSEPVFLNNLMFIGSVNDNEGPIVGGNMLCCFDLKSRNLIWKKEMNPYARKLAVEGEDVFCTDKEGYVQCIQGLNGKTRWTSTEIAERGTGSIPTAKYIFQDSLVLYYAPRERAILMNRNTGQSRVIVSNENIRRYAKPEIFKKTSTIAIDNRKYKITVTDSLHVWNDSQNHIDLFVEREK